MSPIPAILTVAEVAASPSVFLMINVKTPLWSRVTPLISKQALKIGIVLIVLNQFLPSKFIASLNQLASSKRGTVELPFRLQIIVSCGLECSLEFNWSA